MRVSWTFLTVCGALSGCVVDPSATCEYSDNTFVTTAAEQVRVWLSAPKEWLNQTPFLRVDIESAQGRTETFIPRLARIEDMPAPPGAADCREAGELLMFDDPASATEMWKLFEPSRKTRNVSFAVAFPSAPSGRTWVPVSTLGFAIFNKTNGAALMACGCVAKHWPLLAAQPDR
jgi:hypothetical protein